jgi:L-fuculose-phosphate aldolase
MPREPAGAMREDDARAALVAYGRRLYGRGLVAGSSGNISVRLIGGGILTTPTAVSLGALEPVALVRCAEDGTPVSGQGKPTSELPLHLAAYRVRPDIACVVHTHPTYCVGWSKTGALFPLDTVGAIESLGPIAFTRYARSGTSELANICAQAFAAQVDTIVMERHGLSCISGDLETAFLHTDLAEQTAAIEFAAFVLRASNAGRAMTNDPTPPAAAERPASSGRPDLPLAALRNAAGDEADAQSALDEFHAELSREEPDRTRLGEHAERVRGFAQVAGPFERWWLDPRVQEFIAELGATGI